MFPTEEKKMGFLAQPSNTALADAIKHIRRDTSVPHAIVAISPKGDGQYAAHLIYDVTPDGRQIGAFQFNGNAERRGIPSLLKKIRQAVVGGAVYVLLEGECDEHAHCRRSWRLVDARLRTRKKKGKPIEFPFNPI